ELEAFAEVDRLALLGQDLQVALAEKTAELDVEVFRRNVEGAFDYLLDVSADLVAELENEVADRVLPPFRFDEIEDGVAEPVREETGDVAALGDLRNLVGEDRVAEHHPVLVVFVVAEVGRHSLHEPLRRVRGGGPDVVAAEQDLELEDVGELVPDQLLELLVGEVDGEHHPVARRERERVHPFRNEVQERVRLLEVRVGAVIDQVDRFRNLEVQGARNVVVRALGVRGHLGQRRPLRLVEIDAEMGRPIDLPVEPVVDDLVLPELRGSRNRGAEDEGERDRDLLHVARPSGALPGSLEPRALGMTVRNCSIGLGIKEYGVGSSAQSVKRYLSASRSRATKRFRIWFSRENR